MSLFVAFEGPEGSGKTTQIRALSLRLRQAGYLVTVTEEPGGTPLGLKLRQLVKKTRDAEISPWAELFLFASSRAQLVAEVLRPHLDSGHVVLCDRYADSSLAYQGYGRGLDLESIQTINRIATDSIRPDLIVLLDVPSDIGLLRKQHEGWDRFEAEELGFHSRVRSGYLKMAAADPERWVVLDASQSIEDIEAQIWERVNSLLRST